MARGLIYLRAIPQLVGLIVLFFKEDRRELRHVNKYLTLRVQEICCQRLVY